MTRQAESSQTASITVTGQGFIDDLHSHDRTGREFVSGYASDGPAAVAATSGGSTTVMVSLTATRQADVHCTQYNELKRAPPLREVLQHEPSPLETSQWMPLPWAVMSWFKQPKRNTKRSPSLEVLQTVELVQEQS